MIERAREREIYDELRVADACEALRSEKETIDLAIAADLVVYLGDLSPFLAAVRGALIPGGRLLMNAEIGPGSAPYVLRPGGRFAHAPAYVERAAAASGLDVESREEFTARVEDGRPVACRLYVLARR